jgi:hypothetical protein
MIEFFANGLAHNWQWLRGEKNAAYEKAAKSATSQPNKMELNNLNALLVAGNGVFGGLLGYCMTLEMDKSVARINHLKQQLSISNYVPTFAIIHNELMALENSIWGELGERKFTFIPPAKSGFFNQGRLFGNHVYDAFPDARVEITAAGNCIASDLNTAAVFHLMRAAECGLRHLAKKIHIKIKHELVLADWGEILRGIESKLKVLELKKRTKTNERNIIFYSGLLSDLKGFKHVWRNRVMHARAHYDSGDALRVFERVKNFMHLLATNGTP